MRIKIFFIFIATITISPCICKPIADDRSPSDSQNSDFDQESSTIDSTTEVTRNSGPNETDVEYVKYGGYISTKIYKPLCGDCNPETTESITVDMASIGLVSNFEFSNPFKHFFGGSETTTLKTASNRISKNDLDMFLNALDESIKTTSPRAKTVVVGSERDNNRNKNTTIWKSKYPSYNTGD